MSSTSLLNRSTSTQISSMLSVFLADTYLLYLKSQNFHWNVTDPRFKSLHAFFEEQYKELAEACDTIAERIRAIGEHAPATFKEFLELTRLEEPKGPLTADQMLKALLHDHEAIIEWLRPFINQSAELGDPGTSDLCVNRLRTHEKTAWMIRSHFTKGA